MKLFNPLLAIFKIVLISFWLCGTAQAGSTPCTELVGPLHNQVSQIKDRGGMWDRYERNRDLRNHSALAMKIDSKIVALMFTLDYLCTTQEGIPFNDVAKYVVPRVKKNGEEGFIKEHVRLGHSRKEVTEWMEFGKFSEKNLNRKLDFNQIKKTVEQVEGRIKRYARLFENKALAPEVIAETKALIEDIKQFRATDPYLKQADYENSRVPHSSALSNRGDTM